MVLAGPRLVIEDTEAHSTAINNSTKDIRTRGGKFWNVVCYVSVGEREVGAFEQFMKSKLEREEAQRHILSKKSISVDARATRFSQGWI